MITKHELRKSRYIKQEILQLQEQICELRVIMGVPRIPQLSGMPSSGHGELDKIGAVLAKYEHLENIYVTKLDFLFELQKKIEDEIQKLSSIERVLIRYYYIDGFTWEIVAKKIHYGIAQTHRIHALALKKLKKCSYDSK